VPIYEIFAEDSDHFDWFLGSLTERPIQAIDIGGRIGMLSCRLAQVHPRVTIATYEPSSTSASKISSQPRGWSSPTVILTILIEEVIKVGNTAVRGLLRRPAPREGTRSNGVTSR